ncbi:MAG: class II glutamine amidotransferase [Nitrososphaeria archaeon]
MCRMGFVIGEKKDYSSFLLQSLLYYGKSQKDGFGFSYLNGSGIITFKTPEPATKYLSARKINPVVTSSLIFHVRTATSPVNFYNTHPFYSNGYAFAHNGTLFNYYNLKSSLNYNFQGTTDSEVAFATFLRYGMDFIDVMRNKGVFGRFTFILMSPDAIYTYTNTGDMVVYQNNGSFYGTSDVDILGIYNSKPLPKYTVFKINREGIRPIRSAKLPLVKEGGI